MRDEYGVERDGDTGDTIGGFVLFLLAFPIGFGFFSLMQSLGLGRDLAAIAAIVPSMAVLFGLSHVGVKALEWYRIRYRGWSR